MGQVLLIIPPGVRPRSGRDQAIEAAARTQSTLFGLVLLDPSETGRLAAALDSAFMGERVSDNVVEVLLREQRSQADAILAEVGAAARARGVAFEGLIEQGDVEEVCGRIIRAHQISAALLVVERRSWLSRILSGSPAVKLPALANCALTVIEEEPESGA